MKIVTKILTLATLCATSAYQLHAAAASSTSTSLAAFEINTMTPQTIPELNLALINQESNLIALLRTYAEPATVSAATSLCLLQALNTPQVLIQSYAGFNANIQKAMNLALCQACKQGDLAVVETLLNLGADIHYAFGENLTTPLMIAAYANHRAVVELLLARGARPNDRSLDGNTACIYAMFFNKMDIALLLLNYEADPSIKNNINTSFFSFAMYHRNIALLKRILPYININQALDSTGSTALIYAAGRGHREELDILLANKACITLENDQGSTALDSAVEGGHREIALTLALEHIIQGTYNCVEYAMYTAQRMGYINIEHDLRGLLMGLAQASPAAA